MNILFLSIIDIPDKTISTPGLYTDLLRDFRDAGHKVYVACGQEKKNRTSNMPTVSKDNGIIVLHVPIGNVQQTNYLEKGVNTVRLPGQFKKYITRYFDGVVFDVILFATPPVTLCSTVKALKKKNNAIVYLLLKDMWPEGISSLGVIKRGGIIYRFFEAKEKAMYKISDYIGCMSNACVQYLYNHQPQIPKEKIMVCPNCLAPVDLSLPNEEKKRIREDFGLPSNKILIVYGGNLGRAQGVDFLIDCLNSHRINEDVHFVIIGSGLEYHKLRQYVDNNHVCVTLLEKLPRDKYCKIMASSDVGMILLNYNLTVPNTPSRLLDYMQAKLPVLACVDKVTDIGDTIENNGFGWKCASNSVDRFIELTNVLQQTKSKFNEMGKKAYSFYLENYTSEIAYKTIIRAVSNCKK